MNCPNCGAVIPDNAASCHVCGMAQSNGNASAGAFAITPTQPVRKPAQKKLNIYTWIGMIFVIIGCLMNLFDMIGLVELIILLIGIIFSSIGLWKEKQERK